MGCRPVIAQYMPTLVHSDVLWPISYTVVDSLVSESVSTYKLAI